MMLLTNKRISLLKRKQPNQTATKAFGKGYFYLGLLLLTAFIVQETNHWYWPWLTTLQTDDLYKQLSGVALSTYLAHQWHCSVLRNRGLDRKARRLLNRHKIMGSMAPLVFYAHSQSFGFAYLQGLSLVYFSIFLTGLFNVEIIHTSRSWFRRIWIILHVGLSTGLLLLVGYHIFISYAYQ